MKSLQQDFIIIGSGFGAAPPAMRLAQQGLSVTVLEKGPDINPMASFKQTQDPKYLLKYLKTTPGTTVHLNHIEGLGGGSGFYEHISLRAPSLIFRKKDKTGYQYWPDGLDRSALDPFYEMGEKMLSVHQIPMHQIPKTGQVFAQMMQRLGHPVERSRYAVKGCLNCGYCVTGCIYGAKQSLLLNYIPAAKRAGAKFLTRTEALNITHHPNSNYRYTVTAKSKGQVIQLQARSLILAAGTIGTAKLLMQSSAHLPKLSKQLGQNVSFNGSIKQLFKTPDWCRDGDLFTGRSNPGVISYAFLESDDLVLTAAKVMPLQLFGVVRIFVPETGQEIYWGSTHAEFLRALRKRMMIIFAQGYTGPNCRLAFNKKGRLTVYTDAQDELATFKKKGTALVQSLIRKSGGIPVRMDFMRKDGVPYSRLHFSSSHQLGSCRMADSPEKGVINRNGEVFGYPGMYVTDGAALPGSLVVNPSLTILANAERITANLISNMH